MRPCLTNALQLPGKAAWGQNSVLLLSTTAVRNITKIVAQEGGRGGQEGSFFDLIALIEAGADIAAKQVPRPSGA